jgi:hypothetical protein
MGTKGRIQTLDIGGVETRTALAGLDQGRHHVALFLERVMNC